MKANLGALVLSSLPSDEIGDLARALEGWGFSSFWYPDEKYFRDCFVGLAVAAVNTKRLRLGTCVVDPFSRHPIQTAAAIGTIADLAPGRTVLGMGAGGRGFDEIGIIPMRPVRAIRESVEILRGLLRGEQVNYAGEVISLKERALDFKPCSPVDIMIATGHGKRVRELAGEVADIAMLANFASPETIGKGIADIRAGAEKAGRSLEAVQLVARVDVGVSSDPLEARKAVAPRILSAFRASYPELSYLRALPEFALSSRFLEALGAKDYATKAHFANPENSYGLIPEVLFEHMAIAGAPDYVAERIRGLDHMGIFGEIAVCLAPCPGQSLVEAYEVFAGSVFPLLR